MWPIERCAVLPEPGTKVSVNFEIDVSGGDYDHCGYEDHWVDGVVVDHEEIDGRTLAVVELDTTDFSTWAGLIPCGEVEVVGSVRVHCGAASLATLKVFPPRDGPFVSPLYGPANEWAATG